LTPITEGRRGRGRSVTQISAADNYVADTAVTWPGRLPQIRSLFRTRSPDQMLATAAPWTSPWLPPGYKQKFWDAALVRIAGTHP